MSSVTNDPLIRERRKAVNYAIHTLRLDERTLSPAASELLQPVINGRSTFDTYREGILEGVQTMPEPPGSGDPYAYSNGVLRNRFGITDGSALAQLENDLSVARLAELQTGMGPKGRFDLAHIKALHQYVYQDVYPWAGTMRDETATIKGVTYRPYNQHPDDRQAVDYTAMNGKLSTALKGVPPRGNFQGGREAYSRVAGTIMREMKDQTPFRGGNWLTVCAFNAELARSSGLELQLHAIQRRRVVDADSETKTDPDHAQHSDILRDASDRHRTAALIEAYEAIKQFGKNPNRQHVRTIRPGEALDSLYYAKGSAVACVIDANHRVVVAAATDVPVPPLSGQVHVRNTVSFEKVMNRPATQELAPEQLLELFRTKTKDEVREHPILAKAHEQMEAISREIDKALGFNYPDRQHLIESGKRQVEHDIQNGKSHDQNLAQRLVDQERTKGRSHDTGASY